jgi:glutamine synthetase
MSSEDKFDGKVKASPESVVKKFLEAYPSVKIIIVQWIDICGVLRSRMLPVKSFLNLVTSESSLNCSPLDLALTSTEEIVPRFFDYFTDRGKIYPDLKSLKVAAHDGSGIGNIGIVYGNVEYLNLDARLNLMKIVEKAEKEHGLKFLVGLEIEVCFLRVASLEPAGPGKPGLGNSSYSHRSVIWPILNEAALALSEADIHIEQIIKEYGASQWEMALPPLPPLEAIDTYVYAREVIKNVAHKHGVVATFYPTPYTGDKKQTTGQHIHISANPIQDSSEWDPDCVMAGIISHIPALMAIGLSQVDSYLRVGAAVMCTGGYLGWGENHRDMPVRRITKNHWEIRTHDSTSNAYAMVAGIIAAALDPKPLQIKGAKGRDSSMQNRFWFTMLRCY